MFIHPSYPSLLSSHPIPSLTTLPHYLPITYLFSYLLYPIHPSIHLSIYQMPEEVIDSTLPPIVHLSPNPIDLFPVSYMQRIEVYICIRICIYICVYLRNAYAYAYAYHLALHCLFPALYCVAFAVRCVAFVIIPLLYRALKLLYITLPYLTLSCPALRYVALRYVALRCVALHFARNLVCKLSLSCCHTFAVLFVCLFVCLFCGGWVGVFCVEVRVMWMLRLCRCCSYVELRLC